MKRSRKITFAALVFTAALAAAFIIYLASISGPTAGVPDTPGFYRPGSMPGLAHEHAPGMEGALNGVSVRIDSLGYRGAEISREKAGARRVVVLGDSVVFGQGVEEDSTIPVILGRVLAQKHPDEKWEVINAGVRGYNMKDYLIVLKPRVLSLRPDLVVLVITEINDPEREPFVPRSEKIEAWKNSRWAKVSFLKPLMAGPLAREINRLFFLHVSEMYDPDGEYWPTFIGDLDKVVSTCREAGTPLVAVSYPFLDDEDLFAEERGRLHQALDKMGVTWVDPLAEFQQTGASDLVVSQSDFHPNERANRILAGMLAEPVVSKVVGEKDRE